MFKQSTGAAKAGGTSVLGNKKKRKITENTEKCVGSFSILQDLPIVTDSASTGLVAECPLIYFTGAPTVN